MNIIPRVSPEETKWNMTENSALLVCAYDSEARFDKMRLEGALSLEQFIQKTPSLAKEQEIIFY